MREYIKSYHAFLPARYMKWIIYLLYPAVMLIAMFGGKLFGIRGNLMNRMMWILIAPAAMIGVECLLDMFIFAGFGSRGNIRHMEYIRASVRGVRFARQALIVDAVRRMLYLAVIAFAGYVSYRANGWGTPDRTLIVAWLCFLTSMGFLGSVILWIIRLTDNRTVQFSSIYFTCIASAPLAFLLFDVWAVNKMLLFGCCMGLYIVSAVGQVWYLSKKLKEGYYDR